MEWFWLVAFLIVLFGFVVFFGAPYVPSKRRDVERAFTELYPLGKNDVLLDIGSGDGTVLRSAAQQGAKAIGFELNPILVLISRLLSRHFSGIEVRVANMWHASFPSETTVVYVFGVSRDASRLREKLQAEAIKLKRPLYVICYGTMLAKVPAIKNIGAHFLYKFHPLQPKKT